MWFDEHEFWVPLHVRAGRRDFFDQENYIYQLNILLTAIETPARFCLSFELYDFVHSRIINQPRILLKYASKSELAPFYFFICKN
ncbi:MAG: hypothetical protein K6T34_03050 [Thermoflavifilum sp.]|nr:hypothetical protein [Thermoflavifilum sp.]